jgi:hypothetical protein
LEFQFKASLGVRTQQERLKSRGIIKGTIFGA